MALHITDSLAITDLPRVAIEDCAAPGPADQCVDFWRRKLEFTVDRSNAIRCLKGYGAWDDLEQASDDTLAERVLWLACSDFREFIFYAEEADINPFGERPDSFDPPAGSDIFAL